MSKPDRTTVYLLINAVLFTAGVIFMLFISAKAGDYVSEGVFYVYPKRPFEKNLTQKEINAIEKHLTAEGMSVSYETRSNERIKNGNMSADSKVIYTNAEYAYANRLLYTDGGFFVKSREQSDVIVLSEALAWRLFGNTKAAGMTVAIGNTELTVAGVVAQKKLGEENFCAWLPREWGNKEIYTESLYIQSSPYNKIDSHMTIANTLAILTERAPDYRITDINDYVSNISKRPIVALSLPGLYIALVLAVKTKSLCKKVLSAEKTQKRDIGKLAAYIAAIIAIALMINLDISVPGFHGEGVRVFYKMFFNLGRLPSPDYLPYNLLTIDSLNNFSNISFAVCAATLINIIFLPKPNFRAGGKHKREAGHEKEN